MFKNLSSSNFFLEKVFFLDDDHYLNYISWFLPGKPWSFMESQRNSSSASHFNIFMCFFRWFFHSMHMSRRQAKWQTHRNNNPHAISCLIIVFSAISIFLTLPKFSRKQTSFEKNPLGSPTVDFDCPRDGKMKKKYYGSVEGELKYEEKEV